MESCTLHVFESFLYSYCALGHMILLCLVTCLCLMGHQLLCAIQYQRYPSRITAVIQFIAGSVRAVYFFPKGISSKEKLIARLEFEFLQTINYVMRTPSHDIEYHYDTTIIYVQQYGFQNFYFILIIISSSSSSSSSSCRAASTDIPDTLSLLLPIVYRLWQVFRVTSCILTELLYVCSSWSSCFCSAICGGP